MAGTLVTWAQVMDLVRALDAKRTDGERVGEEDADRLLTMLLAFNDGVVRAVPTTQTPSERVGRDRD